MKILVRIVLAIFTIAAMIQYKRTDTFELALVLILFVLSAYNAKFDGSVLSILFMTGACGYLTTTTPLYLFTYAFVVFEIMLLQKYFLLLVPFTVVMLIHTSFTPDFSKDLLLLVFAALLGFGTSYFEKKEKLIYEMFDRERNYRYETERSKDELMSLTREIGHSTRLKERNRIARDIHDNVGHKLAGIIIQLRAARKLQSVEPQRAGQLMDDVITRLSGAMDLLRETVHSIKPAKDGGLDQIKEIVDDFKFCDIDLSINGDFNDEEPAYLNILAKNLKESLTNVARHSDADKVDVLLESRPGYLRMVVKDNGTKKAEDIREGMGLSGMRERLRNIGGNFSFGYEDGFVQVSFITRREQHEDPRS